MVWSGGSGLFWDWEKLDAGGGTERMKEMMNVEALSRAELLTLLSILEGELEAQDVVIHTLRAQHRDAFIQERYGQYDLSDPFLALQRDSEVEERQQQQQHHTHHPGGPPPPHHHTHHGGPRAGAVGPNPLAVLKLVMAHCKRMQERMMGQLAAAESRHRRVIADLEEEKRRRAQDMAQGDDITCMLQNEREKLLQQLELERAAVRRLEKEQALAAGRAEESLSQQRELSSALTQELQKASGQALEEAQRLAQLRARLQEESDALESLRGALAGETGRAAGLEARAERQLAEFDTEREQMKARLRKEHERSRELERQVEELRKRLEGGGGGGGEGAAKETAKEAKESTKVASAAVSSSGPVKTEPDGKAGVAAPKAAPQAPKVNGHHKDTEPPPEGRGGAENGGAAATVVVVENGGGGAATTTLHSPLHHHPPPHPHSPSSTASSSLSSSPISSPVLAKRLGSPLSSYQAGINQRFHAARHKFQSQAELEQSQAPLSPRDLSPTATPVPPQPPPPPPPENSAAKQLARNTVTQVLSRFTSQQAGVKQLAPVSSSPFGTDYRNVASPPPPGGGRSPSSGPLSPGLGVIRSPLTPRSERSQQGQSHPPIPPKKPGMSPTPGSPGGPGASSSSSSSSSRFPELTGGGSCGHNSNGQEGGGAKEPDLLLTSS